MRVKVVTLRDRCCTCGTCVGLCPNGAITLDAGFPVTDPNRCKGCGQCVPSCPGKAKRFELPTPDEREIRRALGMLGRTSRDREYDCGACGFRSCREKAIAICLGLSSPEGCFFRESAGPEWAGVSAREPHPEGEMSAERNRSQAAPGEPLYVPITSDISLVAYSVEMGKVVALAEKMSKVTSTVLITGESGVGKEVIARFIHRTGERARGPFIKINCGAIPESLLESELFGYEAGAFTGAKREGKPGLIEMASGGSLFLDEISELPLNLQVKLLQVIQERQITRIGGTRPSPVDIRIMAATNRDLEGMVKQGAFRADLYYRLNVVPIRIPPLRERTDDIIPLTYHFLERFSGRYGKRKSISEEAKEILRRYSWPGNVRELENLIERLVVTVEDEVILPRHMPAEVLEGIQPEDKRAMQECIRTPRVVVRELLPLREACEEVERQLLSRALEEGKSTHAMARILGVNQSTVVRKLQKYAADARLKRALP